MFLQPHSDAIQLAVPCCILIGKQHHSAVNRSRFIVKMSNHVTISDEINHLNLHCGLRYILYTLMW